MENSEWPRMCNVLGIAPWHNFYFKDKWYMLDGRGAVIRIDDTNGNDFVNSVVVADIVNCKSLIKKKVSSEQLEHLKAARLLFDAEWIFCQPDGKAIISVDKPYRPYGSDSWLYSNGSKLPLKSPLRALVSCGDKEPLRIKEAIGGLVHHCV